LEVATAISKRTGIELCLDGLVKVKQTPQLKDVFDFKARVAALEGAFTVEKAKRPPPERRWVWVATESRRFAAEAA